MMKNIACLFFLLPGLLYPCAAQAETYDASWGLFIILNHCGDNYACMEKTVDAYTFGGLVPTLKRALGGKSHYPISRTKKGNLTKEDLKFMTYREGYRNAECIVRAVYDPETQKIKRMRISGDCAESKAPPMPESITFEK